MQLIELIVNRECLCKKCLGAIVALPLLLLIVLARAYEYPRLYYCIGVGGAGRVATEAEGDSVAFAPVVGAEGRSVFLQNGRLRILVLVNGVDELLRLYRAPFQAQR